MYNFISNIFGSKQPQQQQQQPAFQQQTANYYSNVDEDDCFSFSNNKVNACAYNGAECEGNGAVAKIRRIGPLNYTQNEYENKEVCAVILTVNNNGSTYDPLYSTVEQKAPTADQFVSVFQLHYSHLQPLYNALLAHSNSTSPSHDTPPTRASETAHDGDTAGDGGDDGVNEMIKIIINEMKDLDADSVVLNFECSGGCSEQGFPPIYEKITMMITELFVQMQHIVLFSDFTLKALIKTWKESEVLGHNPFLQIGTFSNTFTLEFDAKELIDCPFAQLQNVGELCEKGKAVVHAMGGTILYSIDPKVDLANNPYHLSLLTVVTNPPPPSSQNAVSLHNHSGSAGHVLLKYKNGGSILTSCGHWIELVKLDVSMETVLSHAAKNCSDVEYQNFVADINSCSGETQRQKCYSYANNFVQSSAPCKYKKAM